MKTEYSEDRGGALPLIEIEQPNRAGLGMEPGGLSTLLVMLDELGRNTTRAFIPLKQRDFSDKRIEYLVEPGLVAAKNKALILLYGLVWSLTIKQVWAVCGRSSRCYLGIMACLCRKRQFSLEAARLKLDLVVVGKGLREDWLQ